MKHFAPYEFWGLALAGHDMSEHMHDGVPHEGFYRKRMKKGQPLPVAIFPHDGELTAMVGETIVDPHAIWIDVCRSPVDEEAYRKARATGQWDDVSAVAMPRTADQSLSERIEEASQCAASEAAKIVDDTSAAAAQSYRSALLAMAREADTKRKDLKQPHLEAGKAVDAEWMPLVKKADDAAGVVARALGVYETAKAKAHVEERRNEPMPSTIKGGTGRAASIKIVHVVTRITDLMELFVFLKSDPELHAVMLRLAQKSVSSGCRNVPGVKIEEQRKVS